MQIKVKIAAHIPTFPICSANNDNFCCNGVSSCSDCNAVFKIPYCERRPIAKTNIEPLPYKILEPEIKNGLGYPALYYFGTLFLIYRFSPVMAD